MPLRSRTYNHKVDEHIIVLEYQLTRNGAVRTIMMNVRECEFMIVGLEAAHRKARAPKAADPE
jgi:hypothetical protein